METPLLVRDQTQDMTEFWSPNRRPPRAPPSSPKLATHASDGNQRKKSSNRFQNLAYVDHQLGYTSSHSEACCPKAHGTERPPHRFSFQSQCSSDEENSARDDIQQQILYCDDDELTLIDNFSPTRSSVSEAHTLYSVSTNPSSDMLDSWTSGSPGISSKFHNPWTATVPTRTSLATATSIHPRSGMPKSILQDHRVSCPLQTSTGQKNSPRVIRSTTPDPDMAIPLLNDDGERSQSWAGFDSHRPNSSEPRFIEPSEKSSWDPDSSDDEQHGKDDEKPGRFRKKVGRRLTDTFRPLFCRS